MNSATPDFERDVHCLLGLPIDAIGWAQVNGLRGETQSVEKMKARIDHDLDYLRNWSLRLDLYINL